MKIAVLLEAAQVVCNAIQANRNFRIACGTIGALFGFMQSSHDVRAMNRRDLRVDFFFFGPIPIGVSFSARLPPVCSGGTALRSGDESSKSSIKPASAGKTSVGSTKVQSKDRDMGAALRTVYQKTVEEDVPADLLDLLGKLD